MRLWAIAFLSGILSVQQLSSLPDKRWLFVVSVIAVFLLIAAFKLLSWRAANKKNLGRLILASGFAFGLAWALGHAHWMMGQRLQAQYEGVDLIVEGMVSSLPASPVVDSNKAVFSQQRVRFDFTLTRIIRPDKLLLADFPKRIRLSWYRPPVKIEAGTFWRFTVRLKSPYGLSNPGGFNYENWLYQSRIQARGYIRGNEYIPLIEIYSPELFLSKWLLKFRQSILNKISVGLAVGENTEFTRHLTQALILGYRSGLTASQWQIFQRTGTIHLMAISGLHIGLVAGLVYLFAGFLWRLTGRGCLILPAPQVAAVAALLAAALYAALAGFTIPTQRALVMLSVAMLHIVFKRTPLPASKVIALSLILVLLLDPLAVLAQGFWLSFLAVGLIIFLMQRPSYETERLDELASTTTIFTRLIRKAYATVVQFGRIQWALTIAMFPLVLFFYQSSSLVSPLANFVAIPVMSLAVVPLMFIATALLFLNTAVANILFGLVDFIYSLLWIVLETLANWQFSTLSLSVVSPWLLASCFLAILLWLTVKGTPMRWLALILFLPVLLYSGTVLKTGEATVTVLDVGQGLSAVIQTKSHTVVFDTGPRYSPSFDTGRAVVVPYLRQMRRASIDTLIISHGDNDHIGGLKSIIEMLPVKRILSSIPSDIRNKLELAGVTARALPCQQGQQWQYDGVVFSILSPLEIIDAENGHDENNQSCVLKISTDFGVVLLTGDIERETESYLYHAIPSQLAADVLVVPHHGSNTSSLSGFIKAVSPQYAVFTVGYKNRYRLPNKKVLQRYQQNSSATLFKTHVTGALTFHLKRGASLKPKAYRPLKQRYWHTRHLLQK
ncbi:DNA internalization-related competence protein ComEC/Rec2 [hydrothermal vent metagenome]|uniref:DNA internalization-related competence protein ComEC/Rec2 n=1 Tax=hydrothermal vent metagenome TaxID=652676 RepID=A0A3B1AF39_9ZZZZ